MDELNDSNSFLSQAINSAVKDLEHSVVDPDWFLQNDPAPPYPATPSIPVSSGNIGIQQQNQHGSQVFQKPLPPSTLTPSSLSSSTSQSSSSNVIPANTTVLIPSPFPSPSAIIPSSNSNVSKQIDKADGGNNKFPTKDSFDFEIVEQLINEQQQFTDEVDPNDNSISSSQQSAVSDLAAENRLHEQENITLNESNENIQQDQEVGAASQTNSASRKSHDSNLKYRDAASSIKRFDPKFRALTEAFRLKNEEEAKAAAIASGSNIDHATIVNDENAPSTQDSGIMSQEASQADSLNDTQVQEDKFFKYIAVTQSSSSTSAQTSSTSMNHSHQNNPSNVHQIPNTDIVGMSASSELAPPMLNVDRYQPYQNNRLIPETDLLRQTNQQHLASSWNEIPKNERSTSVPSHSIAPTNYNCYINASNTGADNRQNNLSIFVDNGTPPPQQQQTLHSPTFINCSQQDQLQHDCMQQQPSAMGTLNPLNHCRSLHGNVMQAPMQRNPQNEQIGHQQQMIQTPTHQSETGLLPESDAKPWPPQLDPTSRCQQLPSNPHQDSIQHENYSDIVSSNNSFAISGYPPVISNQSNNDMMVPSQNQMESGEIQSQQHKSNIKGTKSSIMSPTLAMNPPENTTYQETLSNVQHQNSATSAKCSFFDTNNINDKIAYEDVKYKKEAENSCISGDTDFSNYKPKISASEIHTEDHSLDPFFSSKIGKKKLASKHKLYSEKIRKHKSSSNHQIPNQQKSLGEKELLSSSSVGSIRVSDLSTKSSAQNQHIKKAKLLASSEHRKHVEHKHSQVKIVSKSEDKFESVYKTSQPNSCPEERTFNSEIENYKSDCSSVPLSYETEEIVTTEESGIISSSPPGKLLIADEDDSILQNDNNEDSLPTEEDISLEAPATNDIEPYENEGNSDILENTTIKPPHEKRTLCISIDSHSFPPSTSTSQNDAIKSGIKSCDKSSYTSISAVRLKLVYP